MVKQPDWPTGMDFPTGIDAERLGRAQIDDAYLASEESDAAKSGRRIIRDQRRAEVWDLVRLGLSQRDIAAQLDMSKTAVGTLAREAAAEASGQFSREERRVVLITRLERLSLVLWSNGGANRGESPAVKDFLATTQLLMKLEGLDQGPPVAGYESIAAEYSVMDLGTVDERLAALFEQQGIRVPDSLRQSISLSRAVKKADSHAW